MKSRWLDLHSWGTVNFNILSKTYLQNITEQKKKLEDQLVESERKRADAEKERENKLCLLGKDWGCINRSLFAGISTGLLLLGLVLGLCCGCRCQCCFRCCPKRFRRTIPDLQAPEDKQDVNVHINIDDDNDSVREKQDDSIQVLKLF